MFTLLIKAMTNYAVMAPTEILSRALAVFNGLNGNSLYTNLPVDLPTFKATIDGYSSAIAEALDGGKKAILARDNLGDTVTRMLRQLGHHVEANCKDDLATFVSSGFQPVSTARTTALPLSEAIRAILPGVNSGQLRIRLVAVPDAGSYELRWATAGAGGVPGAWTTQSLVASRAPVAVTGLIPGTVYAFQVRALLQSGFTDWSDSVTCLCT